MTRSTPDSTSTIGDKTLVHVDVEHHMYRAAKEAAIAQLRIRLKEGPFVPKATADELLATLAALQYEWEPSLEALEPELPGPDHVRLARFLLGQLVFSGYAQQTGAPHVLAPKRSMMLATVGLRTAGARGIRRPRFTRSWEGGSGTLGPDGGMTSCHGRRRFCPSCLSA
jgi:hypothetical protein